MNRNLSKGLLAIAMLVLASLACQLLSSVFAGERHRYSRMIFQGDDNWGTGTDADSSIEYADGGLRMKVFTDNYFVWSTPNDGEL